MAARTRGQTRRALIIANPAAGSISRELVLALTTRCRRHGAVTATYWTTEPGHARRIATSLATGIATSTASAGPDLAAGHRTVVLAVGGDGTVREVAAGLAAASAGRLAVPMLAVPAGSGNSCYRAMWADLPWQAAVDRALSDPDLWSRPLDLAALPDRGRLLLSGVSTGISSEVTALGRHRPAGAGRYPTALAELTPHFVPYPGRVLVDGHEIHRGPTMLVNAGGSNYRGGRFRLLPRSVLDDGLLDVCVIGGRHRVADVVGPVLAGEHVSLPGVRYRRGRRVRIDRTDGAPLLFEYDGEVAVAGGGSVTVEVVPAAVRVLVDPAVAVLTDRGTNRRDHAA